MSKIDDRRAEGVKREGKIETRFEGDGLVFPLTWARLICPFYYPTVLSAVKAAMGIGSELFNLVADSWLPICSQYHRVFVELLSSAE